MALWVEEKFLIQSLLPMNVWTAELRVRFQGLYVS